MAGSRRGIKGDYSRSRNIFSNKGSSFGISNVFYNNRDTVSTTWMSRTRNCRTRQNIIRRSRSFDARYISKINFARFSPMARRLYKKYKSGIRSPRLSLPNHDSRRRRKSRAARFSGKKGFLLEIPKENLKR